MCGGAAEGRGGSHIWPRFKARPGQARPEQATCLTLTMTTRSMTSHCQRQPPVAPLTPPCTAAHLEPLLLLLLLWGGHTHPHTHTHMSAVGPVSAISATDDAPLGADKHLSGPGPGSASSAQSGREREQASEREWVGERERDSKLGCCDFLSSSFEIVSHFFKDIVSNNSKCSQDQQQADAPLATPLLTPCHTPLPPLCSSTVGTLQPRLA